jgi:1,4-dihydroxy-2-naphthoate octaprenyltransferase
MSNSNWNGAGKRTLAGLIGFGGAILLFALIAVLFALVATLLVVLCIPAGIFFTVFFAKNPEMIFSKPINLYVVK